MLGIPRLTFMAVLGAAVERGGGYSRIFDEFGIDEPIWRARVPEVEERYGGFQEQDLYPDARRAVHALAGQGYHVGLVANQPASRTPPSCGRSASTLKSWPCPTRWAWPSRTRAFFARVLEMAGNPDPGQLAYAGDRVDNDVIPAAAAGMRAIWVRRGPWGLIQHAGSASPALTVDSLDELVDRIGEAWPVARA